MPGDPGLFALRAALRAALVVPLAFAAGEVLLDDSVAGLFAAFGAIALLILVDFSGPPVARATAYTALAAAGAVLIPLGTLCSHSPVAAALAMAVIGFAVLMAGVIDGYLAAAGPATLLAFILPAMVPADAGEIGARLAGWSIACAITIPAILLLWPRRPHDALRDRAARACRELAQLVAHPGGDPAPLRQAISGLRHAFLATPYRPTGPTGATGALARLIDQLDWLRTYAEAPAAPPAAGHEARLRTATAAVLHAAAARLEGDRGAVPDLAGLDHLRTAVLDDVVRRAAEPPLRDDLDLLQTALATAFDVRLLSFGVYAIGQDVLDATGGAGIRDRFVARQAAALGAARRLARVHASLRSIWFRNSARGALGLSLAVLVAQLATLQHAFWVVLGTLSVLRSSALGTGSTVVRALAGSAAGIVAGGALLLAVGSDTTAMWVLLPVTVGLAAYAPRALSFAAGQAAFTMAVLVLFDLVAHAGWKVGLVRIEDVSIGFAISLGVGVLFWPTGAHAVLRSSVAEAFARAADAVQEAFDGLFAGRPADAGSAAVAARALDAERRLDAALRQRLAERPGQSVPLEACGRLMAGAVRLRRTAEIMGELSERVADAPRPPEVAAAAGPEVAALRDWHLGLAAAIAAATAAPAPRAAGDNPVTVATTAVHAATTAGDRQAAVGAIAAGWGVRHVGALADREPLLAIAAAQLVRRPGRRARWSRVRCWTRGARTAGDRRSAGG